MPVYNRGKCDCCSPSLPFRLSATGNAYYGGKFSAWRYIETAYYVYAGNTQLAHAEEVDVSNGATLIGDLGAPDSYVRISCNFTYNYNNETYRCDYVMKIPFSDDYGEDYSYITEGNVQGTASDRGDFVSLQFTKQ